MIWQARTSLVTGAVALGLIGFGTLAAPRIAAQQAPPPAPAKAASTVVMLRSTLESNPPPAAVSAVLQEVNQKQTEKTAGYTGFVKRALAEAIGPRQPPPNVAAVAAVAATNPDQVLTQLRADQVKTIILQKVKQLSGTTPPPDLPQR